MRRQSVSFVPWFCCSIIACFAVWIWQGSAADRAAGQPATGSPELKMATTQTLGGPDRYLTYLEHRQADLPRSAKRSSSAASSCTMPRGDRCRPDSRFLRSSKSRGPKGDVVASGQVASEDSVLGFQWTVPDGQAGGEYTVQATHPLTGHAPAERKFDIRAYRAPRLKTQIKFLRDGYGPGDDVAATLHVERAEGGVPAGAAGDGDRARRRRGSLPRTGDGRRRRRCAWPVFNCPSRSPAARARWPWRSRTAAWWRRPARRFRSCCRRWT